MAILILMPKRDGTALQNHLQKLDPQLDVRLWPDNGSNADIEFIISWNHPHGVLHQFQNLQVICSYGAGVDHILADPDLAENVLICRTSDAHLAQQMAEYISWAIANHQRGLYRYLAQQHCPDGQPYVLESSLSEPDKALVTIDVDILSIGILGLGQLGQHCAKVLQLNGYHLMGWSRSRKSIAGIQCYCGEEGLTELLKKSRILICLLPLTSSTENILNYPLFKKLPLHAYLINTARGKHLVDDDLIKAIDEGHLSGACLDVFRQEPLPASHRFRQHQKIVVTPHISSLSNPIIAAQQIYINYQRYKNKQDLLNQVDRVAGY